MYRENERRRRGGSDVSTQLTCFLVGGVAGAVLALLFAPKSGQELRGDIADATRKGIDRTRETASQLGNRAGEYYEATRDRASELYTVAADKAGDVSRAAREAAARRGGQLSAANPGLLIMKKAGKKRRENSRFLIFDWIRKFNYRSRSQIKNRESKI
jgi:gas vesicle protein